jgi:hypothetical protein
MLGNPTERLYLVVKSEQSPCVILDPFAISRALSHILYVPAIAVSLAVSTQSGRVCVHDSILYREQGQHDQPCECPTNLSDS